MKYFVIIVELFWGLNIFAQNDTLNDLIINSLKLDEPNPSYIVETMGLNEKLIGLLKDSGNYDTNIMELFDLLYEYTSTEFEDDVDMRRTKTRQCLCYSTIALISDESRFEYFIDLAKYSITDSTGKPLEFLEKQYCGLIMLRILIKSKYDLKIQPDIDYLNSKLDSFRRDLPPQYYDCSKQVIYKFRSK